MEILALVRKARVVWCVPMVWVLPQLPGLHRLMEKVLTRLGTAQIVSSWSLLVSPRVDAQSLMWCSWASVEVYLVWCFMCACSPTVLIPPMYFLFNVPYFLYHNLQFWSQNLFLGCQKEEQNNFLLATQILWGPNVLWKYHWIYPVQSMDEEILIISNYFWWKEPQKQSIQRAFT